MKSDRRQTFFDWLDTLRISLDLGDDQWLVRHEYELHRYDPGVAVLGPR